MENAKKPDQCREYHERHHPRFHQREIVADRRLADVRSGSERDGLTAPGGRDIGHD